MTPLEAINKACALSLTYQIADKQKEVDTLTEQLTKSTAELNDMKTALQDLQNAE